MLTRNRPDQKPKRPNQKRRAPVSSACNRSASQLSVEASDALSPDLRPHLLPEVLDGWRLIRPLVVRRPLSPWFCLIVRAQRISHNIRYASRNAVSVCSIKHSVDSSVPWRCVGPTGFGEPLVGVGGWDSFVAEAENSNRP